MNTFTNYSIRAFLIFQFIWGGILHAAEKKSTFKANHFELTKTFHTYCTTPSDINEHLPILNQLASECTSVAEIGVRSIVSTWALLKGLSDTRGSNLSYLGIDLENPPMDILRKAQLLAKGCNIDFQFWKANDMDINLPAVDMLFIDSMHTYCHLTYELEKFSPQVRKYIAMHDTSAPWGDQDDNQYFGNYSEYPASIDRSKRGLWPAVEDFLNAHPEWCLSQRLFNNHGLTVLKRR